MSTYISKEAVERLTQDCLLARDCLNKTDTFETGQSILDEAAIVLTAQAARIAELEEQEIVSQAQLRDWVGVIEGKDKRIAELETAF